MVRMHVRDDDNINLLGCIAGTLQGSTHVAARGTPAFTDTRVEEDEFVAGVHQCRGEVGPERIGRNEIVVGMGDKCIRLDIHAKCLLRLTDRDGPIEERVHFEIANAVPRDRGRHGTLLFRCSMCNTRCRQACAGDRSAGSQKSGPARQFNF